MDTAPAPTPLRQAAVAAHEMFTEFMAAGFTEDQALTLVARTTAAVQRRERE